jgi:hypothetical protein
MFPDRWWDCSSYLDMEQVEKNVKRVNPLPKGASIKMVLVLSRDEPEFKNIANRVLPYRCAVCADQSYDGAYYKQYPEMNFAMWATDYPLGDAIVVYSTTKPKSKTQNKAKKERQKKAKKVGEAMEAVEMEAVGTAMEAVIDAVEAIKNIVVDK